MIKSIGHVAFAVSNINKSLEFYEKILGFKRLFNLERDGNLWIVYLEISDEQYIELFPVDNINPYENQSYMHLCLHTDDIYKTIEEIKKKGWKVDIDIQLGLDGNYQAWISDPDGNKIEIMQIMPESLQKRSKNLC